MIQRKRNDAFRSGLRALFVSLAAMLIIFGCKKESPPSAPMVPVLSGWVKQASGTVNPMNSVHFIDANTGTVVGDDGVILHTTNGGATWTPQIGGPLANDGSFFSSVWFTDANHGTVTGWGATPMLRTTDGGSLWVYQQTGLGPLTGLCAVTFPDAHTGIAVGGYPTALAAPILRTTNGGVNWNRQIPPVYPVSGFFSVAFPSPDTGYVVGDGGVIIRTDNGGATWVQQNSGVTETLYDVSFPDANTGIAIGHIFFTYGDSTARRDSSWSVILRTTDGGRVWKKQVTIYDLTLNAVCFTDANNGTVVGSEGTILRTTDGGASWVRQISGTTETLFEVFFTDRDNGTVVGDNGVILRTTTGGF